jgi:hypothetical protein
LYQSISIVPGPVNSLTDGAVAYLPGWNHGVFVVQKGKFNGNRAAILPVSVIRGQKTETVAGQLQ